MDQHYEDILKLLSVCETCQCSCCVVSLLYIPTSVKALPHVTLTLMPNCVTLTDYSFTLHRYDLSISDISRVGS